MLNKLSNAVLLVVGGLVAVWGISTLTGVVQGGDLDPPAAPGSTMQELDDLPPSWHKEISGAARFKDFSQAQGYVLDLETGVVWEKTPDATVMTWIEAVDHCYRRLVSGEIGESFGWRLATIEEIGTIIEPTTAGTPKLPTGHPFTGISGIFWTATTDPDSSGKAYRWDSDAATLPIFDTYTKGYPGGRAWCVRSASGFDINAP